MHLQCRCGSRRYFRGRAAATKGNGMSSGLKRAGGSERCCRRREVAGAHYWSKCRFVERRKSNHAAQAGRATLCIWAALRFARGCGLPRSDCRNKWHAALSPDAFPLKDRAAEGQLKSPTPRFEEHRLVRHTAPQALSPRCECLLSSRVAPGEFLRHSIHRLVHSDTGIAYFPAYDCFRSSSWLLPLGVVYSR